MQITRRAFSQGVGGLFGARLAPGRAAIATVVPVEAGADDAYARLLGEYIRVEEAAIATGGSNSASAGAATWEGRQLESFIAELDGRVDLKTTARQLYGEFRQRLRAEVETMRNKARVELPGEGERAARMVDSECDRLVVDGAEREASSAQQSADDMNGHLPAPFEGSVEQVVVSSHAAAGDATGMLSSDLPPLNDNGAGHET